VSGDQIWFTSLRPGAKDNLSVGYISTATGSFTVYGVDANNANLSEIVQGPDGNFWFGVNSEIGRVTPQGSVTLFRTQPKMFNVSILLFGSDGALWFFNGEGGTVGRMSTAGKMLSEKKIPDTANDAILGADGNVWFTTAARSGRSSLIEMTSPKTYTIIKTAKKYTSCVMDGLANGPDGNLWFGNYAAQTKCAYGVGTLAPTD
jgi:streptogramin lyase